jgi:hypothetical protein
MKTFKRLGLKISRNAKGWRVMDSKGSLSYEADGNKGAVMNAALHQWESNKLVKFVDKQWQRAE